MDMSTGIRHLKENGERIRALAWGLSPDEARWRPGPGRWSILEVINHLHDEEREDFRVRLERILNQADEEWPGIDPEGWVTERSYIERDLEQSLASFLAERRRSIDWLETLGEPDWEVTQSSRGRTMSAGDMFAAWVTHDLLHMRQIVELHKQRTVVALAPFDPGYAGPV